MIKHVASITKSLEFKFEFSPISLLTQDQIFNVSILEFILNLMRLANKTLRIINNIVIISQTYHMYAFTFSLNILINYY